MRLAAAKDPGRFHGDIAKREIHWYDPKLDAWITWSDIRQSWIGLDATTGTPLDVPYHASHEPWRRAFNDDHVPIYRWFEGGLTNACFNEVDRHVLNGYWDEIAFYFEGDRWDHSRHNGRGGPVVSFSVTRKQLLLEVVKAAQVLANLGLRQGDRIALNLPNIMEQIYYTEAAKRLGIIYTPIFGGFSDKTLSDRIHNAGARVVITSDGAYRNAQIVPYKEIYTDRALDNYIPVDIALHIVAAELQGSTGRKITEEILNQIRQGLAQEITVERADIMRWVGVALSGFTQIAAADKVHIRTQIAQALIHYRPDATISEPQQAQNSRVDTVVVVRHTGQPDLNWHPERDKWSHELIAEATKQILANARAAGVEVSNAEDLLRLDTPAFVRALYATSRPLPVDAEYPLFIIYTSGSTGKPKGVVHVHGGYVSGVAYTMKVAFDARPGDVVYVIADPGWITGQSYLITAALTTRVTSIVAEGAPLFPSAGRYASIIERYKVNIFKAGVTFLKSVMVDPQNIADVRQYDMSSLRVCTFCAEPTSPTVQQFGMNIMCPQYINSYWATEHGGIVWTHFYGNLDFPLRADAHTYPLPWVLGDVWIEEQDAHRRDGQGSHYRVADYGEKGEIVITQPYPYLARTIWGDIAGFAAALKNPAPLGYGSKPVTWQGDAARYIQTYWSRWANTWAYTQGDFAVKYPDGSFSLHGRSDDVINVSGHRMGTEEIEGAILRDKQLNLASPVGNAIVVGAPHREKGLVPIAFILTAPGRHLSGEDKKRLSDLVRQEKGAVAVPGDYIEISEFPETRSGKYMRRFLRNLMVGEPLGDITSLRNPASLKEIQAKILAWRQRTEIQEEQRLFEEYRFFRIQYNTVGSAVIATVTISNPPVNTLNERSLDELLTIIDHLARREDVKVVIFTGSGTRSFVAGADVKQLLEEVGSLESALTLPNNAQLAFRKVENLNKPVIAAINGVALGGGNEFQMACHYRIAEPTTLFGQPEINLNLLPGYGGTQRLPRLLMDAQHTGIDLEHRHSIPGLVKALEMILAGRNFTASEALSCGLIDEIAFEKDVLSRAAELAREHILTGNGIVKQAWERRQRQASLWEAPQIFPEAVLEEPHIRRIIRQARLAGREKAVQRAVEALRYGIEHGFSQGCKREARLFAEAVIDPEGGRKGIRDFLNKQSPPLPSRPVLLLNQPASPTEGSTHSDERLASHLEDTQEALPLGAPFYPGFTPIPKWQYAQAVVKDPDTGAPSHGDPRTAERQILTPVPQPGPNECLLYVLASEVNFNDIWAITGIPVSPFDSHDQDFHITGSGCLGLIVATGSEVRREGRIKVGDLVTVYSGQSELLSPTAGLDPMFADFQIQGYEGPLGSHQQFLLIQAPQAQQKPADLTLEAAGSYTLNLGTIYRALFTTLQVQPGHTIFIEGAATGTGMEAAKMALRHGLQVTGMVSNVERESIVRNLATVNAYTKNTLAPGVINRRDPAYTGIFTKVPQDAKMWAEWERQGNPLLENFRHQNNGRLADYAVSHAGETAFPRSFQLLEDGGVLTFYGASTGYHFTFIGKSGQLSPAAALTRAHLQAGEALVIYYGIPQGKEITQNGDLAGKSEAVVDEIGLETIEVARNMAARIVVICYTNFQRDFIQSLGYGDAVKGVISLEDLSRRYGNEFVWAVPMPDLPDPRQQTAAFKETLRLFNDLTFKPLGAAIGTFLRTQENRRGYPDVIFERAGHDALGVSTSLVKPFTGRIVYAEVMAGRRYSFYAPQVWMRQRRIYMPGAAIFGTHLSNAYEVMRMNEMIESGLLDVTPPTVVSWQELPEAHQAMWENRHAGPTYVVNHALPRLGLKNKEELLEAWHAPFKM
ncbi:MAG: AMP-binding protein [Chloroflexi bacterium]|nr:AMP-binding protein [Chloroflexota bacterium]